VFTPKSLLREPLAASSLEELSEGSFQFLIDDERAEQKRDKVTRVVLCSGKIYYDFRKHALYETTENVAVVRLERLYPFPAKELRELVTSYPNLKEIVWAQEEPRNMGAWRFLARPLSSPKVVGWDKEPLYIGRPYAASPAEGSTYQHALEQERIITASFAGAPVLARNGRAVARAK